MATKRVQITLDDKMQRDLEDLRERSGLRPSAIMGLALRILHRNVVEERLTDSLIKDMFSLREERDVSHGMD